MARQQTIKEGGREKRSFSLYGHATSVALEEEFWHVLDTLCAHQNLPLARLIAQLDDARLATRPALGLSAYLRVHALQHAIQNEI